MAVVECAGIFNVVDILVLYLRGASKMTIKYGICSECQSKHGSKVLEQEIKHLQLLSTIFSDLKDMEIIFESDSVQRPSEPPQQDEYSEFQISKLEESLHPSRGDQVSEQHGLVSSECETTDQ